MEIVKTAGHCIAAHVPSVDIKPIHCDFFAQRMLSKDHLDLNLLLNRVK